MKILKKSIKIIGLILMTILMMFCSKDNSENEIPLQGIEEKEIQITKSNISGKWKLYEKCSFGAFEETACKEVETSFQHIFEFKEDNTVYTSRYREECQNGTYSLDENEIHMEFSCNNFTIPISKLTENEIHFDLLGDDGGTTEKYKKVV